MNADKELISKKKTMRISIPALNETTECIVARSDKIILSAHAIFEGIGIAGLISAAFWYTTAPMAPDGFKGPISTYTIAITTIISLFLAIPIAYYGFKKLVTDIDSLYLSLSTEIKEFINSHDEILYELLKLRSLFLNDSDFKRHVNHSVEQHHRMITDDYIVSVCQQYNELKDLRFNIIWQPPIRLILSDPMYSNPFDSVSILELLKAQELSFNKSIRKALIEFINRYFKDNEVTFESVVHETYQHIPKIGRLRAIVYGTASGVACTEVLLSIGWTVASILIGVKAIAPVSNFSWIVFAVCSIILGFIFGIGMGYSRHKQKTNQLLYSSLKQRNTLLTKSRDYIINLITEKIFAQQSVKHKVY
jgi:hypothetical protein